MHLYNTQGPHALVIPLLFTLYIYVTLFNQYRKNMNTLIVFSFNLVIPHCQILTVFILGFPPNLKRKEWIWWAVHIMTLIHSSFFFSFLNNLIFLRFLIKLLLTGLGKCFKRQKLICSSPKNNFKVNILKCLSDPEENLYSL